MTPFTPAEKYRDQFAQAYSSSVNGDIGPCKKKMQNKEPLELSEEDPQELIAS